MYNNFEISLVVFIPNITTNHAITYTFFLLVDIKSSASQRSPALLVQIKKKVL